MKILLVEDDETTANVLTQELTTHHYTVETAADGQMAWELAQAFHYDLLVMDILLPKLDGISVCRQLRSHGLQMPILLLSAKDSTNDRVIGLQAGADDYVVKPYELSELIARIHALLRRGNSTLLNILTWEKLQLDPDAGQVIYGEKSLHLTPKEFSILELFLRNPQRIFSRSAILDRIWPNGEFPQEEAVSTQIKGLRQKLKAAGMTKNFIETLYGLGYRLKQVPEDSLLRRDSPEKMQKEALTPAGERQAKAKVQAVIQQVWGKFKQILDSQMALFEQAIVQISTGTLDQELRASAQIEAHRLIGSLGSFGFPKGSEVARQIEKLLRLESLGENEAQQLKELVTSLKQVVEDTPSITVTTPDLKMGTGRLLMIDDDVVLTEAVKREAIGSGFQVEVATDPTSARKSISLYPPDAILLDLTFPHTTENGLNLIGELAQREPKIPVLVLTARNQLSDRVEVARLGGNVFLEKPISAEKIIKAVSHELHRTQKAEARILIVDDDLQVLTALSNLLEPWGFQVSTLADPKQFWQTIQVSVPDLLILDIEMPDFSGIELCQVIRSDPRWSELPVLFLSGHNDAEIIHQVFAVGADDYVEKPIIGSELITRILNRLERTRSLNISAEIDELTGTATRRKSIQELEQLLYLADCQNQPLCFMLLDLDHFKQINDQYGHQAGDRVLSLLGKCLKQFFRSKDIVARWGGEEFILGIYGITRDVGAKRLTEFLQNWCEQKFIYANNQTFQVTFSAGVVEYSKDGANLQELYQAADVVLYQAKAMGRNRVLMSGIKGERPFIL